MSAAHKAAGAAASAGTAAAGTAVAGESCCEGDSARHESSCRENNGLPREFDAFYRAIWQDRWDALLDALRAPPCRAAYTGGLCGGPQKPYLLDPASIAAASVITGIFAAPAAANAGAAAAGTAVAGTAANAGAAAAGAAVAGTAVASAAHKAAAGFCILDACAAPGGKSLVIASVMPPDCRLIANELSPERRRRLARVLDEYLPPAARGRVTVSGFDAAALAGRKSERERFDAVLLDAPCSSERHVLANAVHLGRWTRARPAGLARRQWALLSAAFLLLKPGGTLVYATCSINPAENDGVVNRLLKKYGRAAAAGAGTAGGGRAAGGGGGTAGADAAGGNAAGADAAGGGAGGNTAPAATGVPMIERPDFSALCTTDAVRLVPEQTATGALILPDTSGGAGPMFIAKIVKSAGAA